MDDLSPAFLLENGDLVEPAAPWCVWLDNLELAILLLAQPWLADEGLRRAELERQLQRLGTDMPLGPVYFQRVSRTVTSLEERQQVHGSGTGRSRRFVVTSRGFAALILNLQVIRSDPTIDGAEFEFKRALVAVCNLVLEQLSSTPPDVEVGAGLAGFLDDVERLEVWGRPVVTENILADAFDVLHLIDVQRQRIHTMLTHAEQRFERARASTRLMRGAMFRPSGGPTGGARGPREVGRLVRSLLPVAAGLAPELAARAAVTRYRTYLEYLDRLVTLYSARLDVVDLAMFRRVVGGRG